MKGLMSIETGKHGQIQRNTDYKIISMSNLGNKKRQNKHNQTMKTYKTEDAVIKVKCLKIIVLFGRKFLII